MISIRCSSLDSLFACTPSVVGESGFLRINTAGVEAEAGKIVHELMAAHIVKGGYDIKATCQKRGFEGDEEIADLMLPAVKAWQDIKKYFPTPQVERVVKTEPFDVNGQEYEVTGTCDVLSPVGTGNAIFADWKTGYIDDGYHNQMFGYAAAIWHRLGQPPQAEIWGVVAFLRHRYHRVVKYTVEDIRAWEYDLTHNVLPAQDKYRPGKHCTKCSLFSACPARQQIVRGTLNAMIAPPDGPEDEHKIFLAKLGNLLAGVTEDTKDLPEVRHAIQELIFRVKLAKRVIDDTEKLVRETVDRVGPIKLDNGHSLALRAQERQSLDPVKAFKTLRQHLGDADILEAVRMSLPKLLAAKAGKYGRGEKRAAREQLTKELTAAGAVTVTVSHRLEEVDLKEIGHDDATEIASVGDALPGTRPSGDVGRRELEVERNGEEPGAGGGDRG